MRGITSWGSYLPYRRLNRGEIAKLVGQGGGKGTRTVAGFDEDPTTMAVEASRRALQGGADPTLFLFATTNPAYADKTNATAAHAALRLGDDVPAFDLGASTRSAVGGLLLAARGSGDVLVAAADIRGGLAGSAEEAMGGDAAAAIVFGSGDVVAELIGSASATHEFIDRWRAPGESRTKVWDDKFAETTYTKLGRQAWAAALKSAGCQATDVAMVAVAAPTTRIANAVGSKFGAGAVLDDLSATVGQTGAAQPALLLASLLEQAQSGQIIALAVLADGADVLIFKTTEALASRDGRGLTVAEQAAGGAPLPYGKYLSWRGTITVEPPRRPEPARVSATAAARGEDWKFGFVASRDQQSGQIHMPPQRVSADGLRTDAMEPQPMSEARGKVITYTIDRMAYSPSPPIVFAVVDFDGGGRLPIELCDIDADEVEIGMPVELTFRRLFVQDGIPNYFWKARPVRG